MRKIYFLIAFLTIGLTSNYAQSAYQAGESLKFKIKYGWFKASEATLDVKKAKVGQKDVLFVDGFGKSTGLLDVFFKVRDQYKTYIDPKTDLPQRFRREINEGGHIKNKELVFDHQRNAVKVIDRKHKTTTHHSFKAGSQDMLSVLYFLRNKVDRKTIQTGESFEINLFFDEDNFPLKVKFLGREVIQTEFGNVPTLKFRPYVMAGRVFEEKESLTIWITDDGNKMPIKIEAKLAVGSLTAKLSEFRGLKHSFRIIPD
ncbi:MAG: DUF3108 domain-containing protein [Psychroflexus sp.]|nr:DUF3108 domain-containing protein [Psychroflexus sp.]MDN6310257.1 DUF3108 domain-containing protein [Psychroflexus sp.]